MIPWQYFFSFTGRITRAQFWLDYQLSFLACGLVLTRLSGASADGGWSTAWIVFAIFFGWFGFAVSVKRWHDRDKSGWWILILLIPLVGVLWALVEQGFLRGTRGRNRFGPDALDRAGSDAEEGGADWEPPSSMKWRVVGARLMLAVLGVTAVVTAPATERVAEGEGAGDAERGRCAEHLGVLAPGTYTRSAAWDGSCGSDYYFDGEYARYFSFEVDREALVTLDLTSPDVDTWLALRNEAGLLEENDDGGRATNARIDRVLLAGTYTIEATTVLGGVAGPFTLDVMLEPATRGDSGLEEISAARGADAAGGEGPRIEAGIPFRDCEACPEMVAMPGEGLALGRFEVTVGEFLAFATATGGGVVGWAASCGDGHWWESPGFAQTERHPVVCVSWNDAQEYVAWLSRSTGATYRLPTGDEWERAAVGSSAGCVGRWTLFRNDGVSATCRVGSYGANEVGLSDMGGNAREWTEDCWEGDCGRRVLSGGSWRSSVGEGGAGARNWAGAGLRYNYYGFRVARTFAGP